MFEMNPPTFPPAQITTVLRPVPPKVQPTKPIPTHTSRTNMLPSPAFNINENDEGIQRTGNVKRAPATGISQTTTIQMMTTTGENGDDAGVDDADALHITVNSKLNNTDTMNEVSLDLGSLANSNKNMPEYNMFDDEASQVTVATKNSAEANQYAPRKKLPHMLPDGHDKQFVNIPAGSTTPLPL